VTLNALQYIPVESPRELDVLLTRLKWLYTVFNCGVETGIAYHRSLDQVLCTAPIRHGANVLEIPRATQITLPAQFDVPAQRCERLSVSGGRFNLEDFLLQVNTLGLAVIQDGRLVYERYGLGNTETTKWMSNSASKFVVGMLIAIAQQEGAIKSFRDPVCAYWPELAGTGWEGVTIDHCLRMASGIGFDEYALDLWKDGPYVRLFYGLAFGTIESHVVEQHSKARPGTRAEYSSINTEALGGVLIRATGRSLTDYLEEKIWRPAGMEHDAYWVTDPTGRAFALAGLCATLRDYGRLGMIMNNGGKLNGRQIVPAAYAERLSHVEEGHFRLDGSQNDAVLSWYQVFVPSSADQNEGDYMASGSYGQNIYVNNRTRTVIVTHSMYPDILTEEADMYRHFMAFRTVADQQVGA
jgi:CubicO group peptidase (beta-lactamase class C family)